jgi:hypothetical protein
MRTKFIFFSLLFFATYTCYAAGTEPGNWRWRANNGNASGDTSGTPGGGASWLAPVNKGIRLNFTQVFRLRMQFQSGNFAGSGQAYLQYLDAGTYKIDSTAYTYNIPLPPSTSAPWELHSRTGQPEPKLDYRGSGEASDDETQPNTRVASWTTIGPIGARGLQSDAPYSAVAGTGASAPVFIMAGDESPLPADVIPGAPLSRETAGGIPFTATSIYLTPGKTNNINLLGAPDFLNYEVTIPTDIDETVWSQPAFIGRTNGNTTTVTHTDVATLFPVVGEVEFAIKANPDNAPLPSHIYFFRVRGYGVTDPSTATAADYYFDSPEGTRHVAPITDDRTTMYYYYSRVITWPGVEPTLDADGNVIPGPGVNGIGVFLADGTLSNQEPASTETGNNFTQNNDYRASAIMPYLFTSPAVLSVGYAQILSAIVNNSTVALSWATATETNNKQFVVQRSSNGKDFAQIGVVASKAANGNSTAKISYAFTDNNPANGINYYRLQQQDISGSSDYSNTVSVTVGGAAADVRLYPNPATTTVNIENLPTGSAVIITNTEGYAVYSGTATSSKFSVNVQNLNAGIYFFQYTTNGTKNTIKFVKQ